MSTDILTSFGEMIRLLRLNSNLTQREVAIILDIDTSILSKYERNRRQPTDDQIEKLAEIFNIDSSILRFEIVTDRIANQFVKENINKQIVKIAEKKAEYIKSKKSS